MPIKGASPNKGAPIVWKNPMTSYLAKIYVVSLIIVRFSIRNHRWKAEKVSFPSELLDMVLLERPAPLLGRIRYEKQFKIFVIFLPNNCHGPP